MTKLSVNVNKVALLRNSRGGNYPNVLKFAMYCEDLGADGITVHPRPDERHIRESDVYLLAENLRKEFNIEGYPDARYLRMIEKAKPAQATLVPDPPDVLTSSEGWNVKKNKDFLRDIVQTLHSYGARVSLFMETDLEQIEEAKDIGADRIELYTGPYAKHFYKNKEQAISSYVHAAEFARNIGLEVNAGHDLNLDNLKFFIEKIPFIAEVSIGHALISDALYLGIKKTIKYYLERLEH